VVVEGTPLSAFDYHCPLLSLPLAFKTTLSSIPSTTPYVHADPTKLAYWTNKLGEPRRPRIGLVWSGRAAHKNDRNRSIGLAALVRHLPAGFEYVSLQKDVRDSDKPVLESNPHIRHLGTDLDDFTDTAALCELMDVVISVDTSVAHLSGALGKPTWVLLPYSPDWRWLLERDDSPWYPSVKLFRQPRVGDWGSVLDKVNTDMALLRR
jgi:ADP-heptose:LPS heptosyltransferase